MYTQGYHNGTLDEALDSFLSIVVCSRKFSIESFMDVWDILQEDRHHTYMSLSVLQDRHLLHHLVVLKATLTKTRLCRLI